MATTPSITADPGWAQPRAKPRNPPSKPTLIASAQAKRLAIQAFKLPRVVSFGPAAQAPNFKFAHRTPLPRGPAGH